ncbi:MAG TPA: hypothetical protein VGI23_26705, partial [Steroidobacteraceae bacterium]
MQQIPLGVRIPDRAVFESYLPGPNVQAVEHLMRISAVTWLCGPPSVGKTHLLQAVVASASKLGRAGYFPLTELAPLGIGVLEGLNSLDCICLDDLDRVISQLEWEKALFGLLREIQERDGNLVVAANAPPALSPWSLPDLGSRFTAAAIFQLHEL